MIVLQHNGTIYVAKSCWGFRDVAARNAGVPDVENIPMWHPGKRKNRLIAVSSVGRVVDILRYEHIFPSTLDPKHLVLESYERVYDLVDRFGICHEGNIRARIVFAEDDKAYVVYGDGSHIEVENIHTDCYADDAIMALYDLKGVEDPYTFFREAYRTVEQISRYLMFPVMVMNTKNNKIEVINR